MAEAALRPAHSPGRVQQDLHSHLARPAWKPRPGRDAFQEEPASPGLPTAHRFQKQPIPPALPDVLGPCSFASWTDTRRGVNPRATLQPAQTTISSARHPIPSS